jgi:FtsZ-binding cell division protein ZapB
VPYARTSSTTLGLHLVAIIYSASIASPLLCRPETAALCGIQPTNIYSRTAGVALYSAPLLVLDQLSNEDCENELCSFFGSPEAVARHDCAAYSVEEICANLNVVKQSQENTKANLANLRVENQTLRAGRHQLQAGNQNLLGERDQLRADLTDYRRAFASIRIERDAERAAFDSISARFEHFKEKTLMDIARLHADKQVYLKLLQ